MCVRWLHRCVSMFINRRIAPGIRNTPKSNSCTNNSVTMYEHVCVQLVHKLQGCGTLFHAQDDRRYHGVPLHTRKSGGCSARRHHLRIRSHLAQRHHQLCTLSVTKKCRHAWAVCVPHCTAKRKERHFTIPAGSSTVDEVDTPAFETPGYIWELPFAPDAPPASCILAPHGSSELSRLEPCSPQWAHDLHGLRSETQRNTKTVFTPFVFPVRSICTKVRS